MVFGCVWKVVLRFEGVGAGEVMALRGFGGGEVGLADEAEEFVKGGYVDILTAYRK